MTKFNVPDMRCRHCTATIEKAIKSADVGAVLSFDLEARTVNVTSQLREDAIAKILEDEGYHNSPAA